MGTYDADAKCAGRQHLLPLKQQIQYFHTLANSLPTELTNQQGQIIWQADYQLFGQIKRQHNRHDVYSTDKIEQNLRFAGQYYDNETGLHYNTFRYYDPNCGRFTQPDPIGLAGGINLYQYAPNTLTWIDPWGWACIPNKKAGDAREARLLKLLEEVFSPENVIKQRHLRNAEGKIVGLVDNEIVYGKLKGSRIVDFVVKTKKGWIGIEVTSKTAPFKLVSKIVFFSS